jgi:hypothetical protein
MKLKLITALTLTVLWLGITLPVFAQEQLVKGTVREKNTQNPIAGATVVLKGTNVGTMTDADGAFSIKVTDGNSVLVVQFLGYGSQEIIVGTQSTIDVQLEDDITQLGEVVVTALGITREEESLGYSVTKVDNEDLTKVQTNNWLSSERPGSRSYDE